MITYPDAELAQIPAGERPTRTPGAGAPGRSTLTSRLAASPASIARAVIAQLKEDSAVQARGGLDGPEVHAVAARGTSGSGGHLPHLDQIQRAFGSHDVSGVRAHVGGAAAEASASLGARAYAAGDDVAFASTPDLHLAAHEAAHVVQQRAGVRLAGGVGAAGDEYERHADEVADAVCRGEFVEELLGGKAHRGPAGGPAVQRRHEHINVPWGTDGLGDGSSIDLYPEAEVWVNGAKVAHGDIGRTGNIAVPRGVSGVVRLRCRIRYDMEHTLDDDTGETEVSVGMRFTTDASGALTWDGPSPRHIGVADTRSFTLAGSATGEGTTLSATVLFTGVSGQGPAASGNASIPEVAQGGVESGRTQYPQGGFPVDYIITLTGVTAAASAAEENGNGPGGDGGDGGDGGRAQADARANGRGEGGNGTGGTASSSSQSNPQVNTNDTNTVAPVINNNINVQCPPGQEGQQGQQQQQPEPGQQQPQGRPGELLGEQSFNFEVNDDQLLARGGQPGPLLRLINWAEGVRDRNRETIDGAGARIVVVGYASRTGDSDRNLSLSQRRARTIVNNLSEVFGDNVTFTDDPTGNGGGRGEDTSLNPDGTESADDRRAEVRIYRR